MTWTWGRHGDHLRVCGADPQAPERIVCKRGSPPRVRSRLAVHCTRLAKRGITSACAEQTWVEDGFVSKGEDHLRVCGADKGVLRDDRIHPGSPPRVRSRPVERPAISLRLRITSACAEQTSAGWPCSTPARDHLRVCGADGYVTDGELTQGGSPPRVRSRLLQRAAFQARGGITSACAEQTDCRSQLSSVNWDHLRVCGADRWCASPPT